MDTVARAAELAALLTEQGGIRATHDPAKANPPCVLVALPRLTFDSMAGDAADAEWTLWCLAPGSGGLDSWTALDRLRDAVQSVLPLEGTSSPTILTAMTGLAATPAISCTYHERFC